MSYYVNPHKFSCPWYPYAQEFGAPNIKWCEETLCHWVSEPANTWSNFAYIILALAIGFYSQRKKHNFDVEMFARLFIFTGFASGIYHASNHYLSQLLDFLAMYLFLAWGMMINLKRMGKLNDGNKFYFVGAAVTILMIMTHLFYLSYVPFQSLVVVGVILFLISEFRVRKIKSISYKFLGLGIFFVALGEVFSILDLKRVMCDPQNHILQGHALWHILGAIGLGFFYLHFDQEVPLKEVEEDAFTDKQSEENFDFQETTTELQSLDELDSKSLEEEYPESEEQITKDHDISELEVSDKQNDQDNNDEIESNFDPAETVEEDQIPEDSETDSDQEDEIDKNQLDLFNSDDDKDKKD